MNAPITAQQTSDLVSSIDFLEARWQDEQAYEDFAEYQQAWKNDVERYVPGATSPKLTRRPFAGKLQVSGHLVTVKVTGRGIEVLARQLDAGRPQ